MKRFLAFLALSVATFVASAQQTTSARVDAYKGALAEAYLVCSSAYQQAQLDQQLSGMAAAQQEHNYGTTPDYQAQSDAAGTAAHQFAACKADARGKGIEAFKTFAAGLPDGKLKADGRALLAAWIAFLGNASGSVADYQSPQGGEYGKAAAALDLDAAGV